MLRRLLVLAIAAALTLTPALTHADTPYTSNIDVALRMSDGVRISLNEFVPASGCPCPVVIRQTPYRKGTTPDVFPSHGYAEIVTDVRGTGSSEGYWDVFGEREQKDGAEIVKFAASQPWSNGKVALYGESYMAINQFLTAEQPGMDAIKAMMPVVPMSDSYRDVVWGGGAFNTAFMPWWYALVNAEALEPTDNAQSDPQMAFNVETQHLLDVYGWSAQILTASTLGAYQSALCQMSGNAATTCAYPDTSYDSSEYRTRSPIERVGNIHIPTFIVGGEWDIFQRGEPALYHSLNLPDDQKKLLIGPWYHVTAGSGLPSADENGTTIPSLDDLALAWYDHWLKGIDNGIDSFPNVETYELGANKWVPSSSFPMAGTTYKSWHLSPDASGSGSNSIHDGSLSDAVSAPGSVQLPWLPVNGVCSRSTQQWSAGLSALATSSPTPCETDNRQNELQGLTFTSSPMGSPTVLSGPMNLHLFVSTSATDTSLAATVSDVAPDGTSNSITAGSLVASLRQVVQTPCDLQIDYCSLYANGEIVEPWHPYTKASQQLLEPNVIYELQLEIYPTTAEIASGHRLRVSVFSGDAPHRFDTLSTLTAEAGGITNVFTGPAYDSRLYAGVAP
ncbi:MAG: CocE/NonD family hydrolase [Actinomycetota bacterium]